LTRMPGPREGVQHVPYAQRGWTTFEQALAALSKPPGQVLDLGLLRPGWTCWGDVAKECRAVRRPPAVPETFLASASGKAFASPEHLRFVADKYREVFHKVMGATESMPCDDLGWSDADAQEVAAVLPLCPRLRSLDLSNNRLGLVGATALAEAVERCDALQSLDLRGNFLSDEAVKVLELAWTVAGKPVKGLKLTAQQLHMPKVARTTLGKDAAIQLSGGQLNALLSRQAAFEARIDGAMNRMSNNLSQVTGSLSGGTGEANSHNFVALPPEPEEVPYEHRCYDASSLRSGDDGAESTQAGGSHHGGGRRHHNNRRELALLAASGGGGGHSSWAVAANTAIAAAERQLPRSTGGGGGAASGATPWVSRPDAAMQRSPPEQEPSSPGLQRGRSQTPREGAAAALQASRRPTAAGAAASSLRVPVAKKAARSLPPGLAGGGGAASSSSLQIREEALSELDQPSKQPAGLREDTPPPSPGLGGGSGSGRPQPPLGSARDEESGGPQVTNVYIGSPPASARDPSLGPKTRGNPQGSRSSSSGSSTQPKQRGRPRPDPVPARSSRSPLASLPYTDAGPTPPSTARGYVYRA